MELPLRPPPGQRRAYLNHLVGVGVVEHQLGEGRTAGWNENRQGQVSSLWLRDRTARHHLTPGNLSAVSPRTHTFLRPGSRDGDSPLYVMCVHVQPTEAFLVSTYCAPRGRDQICLVHWNPQCQCVPAIEQVLNKYTHTGWMNEFFKYIIQTDPYNQST